MKNTMNCSNCKKKTYFDRAKIIDRKTNIAISIGIIIIGLSIYGLIQLIKQLK